MINAIRTWLLGIVTTSLAISLVETLVPAGTLRRILSITGGLILLLVILQPLLRVDLQQVKLDTSGYRTAIQERQTELEDADDEQLTKLIEEKTESYISDKAEQLGISCTVRVIMETGEDGVPYPASAVLGCASSEALSVYLEQELGIPRERQIWNGTENGA